MQCIVNFEGEEKSNSPSICIRSSGFPFKQRKMMPEITLGKPLMFSTSVVISFFKQSQSHLSVSETMIITRKSQFKEIKRHVILRFDFHLQSQRRKFSLSFLPECVWTEIKATVAEFWHNRCLCRDLQLSIKKKGLRSWSKARESLASDRGIPRNWLHSYVVCLKDSDIKLCGCIPSYQYPRTLGLVKVHLMSTFLITVYSRFWIEDDFNFLHFGQETSIEQFMLEQERCLTQCMHFSTNFYMLLSLAMVADVIDFLGISAMLTLSREHIKPTLWVSWLQLHGLSFGHSFRPVSKSNRSEILKLFSAAV